MERLKEEQFFKTVIDEETQEAKEVLDYTMRYTYEITTVMVGVPQEDGTEQQLPQEIETLVKTEKVMKDGIGTTYLITEQCGCICVMQTYPIIKPEPKPPTQEEILEQRLFETETTLLEANLLNKELGTMNFDLETRLIEKGVL